MDSAKPVLHRNASIVNSGSCGGDGWGLGDGGGQRGSEEKEGIQKHRGQRIDR